MNERNANINRRVINTNTEKISQHKVLIDNNEETTMINGEDEIKTDKNPQ
ncbi:hypothetical protein ACCW76_16200 [Pantoea sp. C8B4]